jgi:hypothetical protein
VKFDPNQPRAPLGTNNGGQWTGSGHGSGGASRAKAASPPPPPARAPVRLPRPLGPVVRAAALPVIAGGVALQRTAGSFAARVSGQSKTPLLNIPFATPTIGSLPARRSGGSYGRPSPPLSKSRRESGSVDRQCEAHPIST